MQFTTQYSLPVPLTPLIGREREMELVQQYLCRSEIRLVTLTGPGGVGKTRLALQIALNLVDEFADVRFVSLASTRDPASVLSALARACDIEENKHQALFELLKDRIGHRSLLLLLDNFEQILPAAPTIAALLRACPALKVLITSRFLLRLSGEYQFSVSPLAVPDPMHLPALDVLAGVPAISLFLWHIQRVKHNFQLDETTAYHVSAICAHIDGLPLAIEMAAARLKLFSLEELLVRLRYRFQVLANRSQDLPTRQQTLQNSLEWSYNLLSKDEQRLFRCLACFSGGCTFNAVEVVCQHTRVVECVEALLDKSLLYQKESSNGEARLLMLQTVREYALQQFTESDERDTIQDAHANYYLACAERYASAFRASREYIWLKKIEGEHDNFDAALRWLLTQRKSEEASRLASTLSSFRHFPDDASAGSRWRDGVFALSGTAEIMQARAQTFYNSGERIQSPTVHPSGLTSREVEVLRLLTQGLTYTQIAGRLVISSRTVDAHLRSVYSKLGVTSRNNAIRYALEHQLV